MTVAFFEATSTQWSCLWGHRQRRKWRHRQRHNGSNGTTAATAQQHTYKPAVVCVLTNNAKTHATAESGATIGRTQATAIGLI